MTCPMTVGLGATVLLPAADPSPETGAPGSQPKIA